MPDTPAPTVPVPSDEDNALTGWLHHMTIREADASAELDRGDGGTRSECDCGGDPGCPDCQGSGVR